MIKFENSKYVNYPTAAEVADWHARHPEEIPKEPTKPPPDVPWPTEWCPSGEHWFPAGTAHACAIQPWDQRYA